MKKWSDLNRKEKITGTVTLVIIGFILLIILTPSDNSSGANSENTQETAVESAEALTPEQQVEKLATSSLQGQNNMDKDYLRNIEVLGDEAQGYTVNIEFNANDNLSTNLRKTGIESAMSEIYTDLYTSNLNINIATITAYFPLRDEYGNESDGTVYISTLPKEEAEKVNWDAPEATLQLRILPNIWTTLFLHPEFQ